MRGWRTPTLGLTLLIFTPGSLLAGQQKPCTDTEERQAEKAVDLLKTWDQVYRAYKTFAQCDDGAIAEGFSDSVGKLLANDWRYFPRLMTLAKSDADFANFVVKHVDESLPSRTLEKISKHVKLDCPPDGKKLCGAIEAAVLGK
jgi:hypothetical protein